MPLKWIKHPQGSGSIVVDSVFIVAPIVSGGSVFSLCIDAVHGVLSSFAII